MVAICSLVLFAPLHRPHAIAEGKGVSSLDYSIKALTPLKQPSVAPVAELVAVVTPKPVYVAPPVYSGSHTDWMAQAGISPADYACADAIAQKESGWSVTSTNPSSGSYGIPQSLPASKMAAFGADYLTNPITQLKWMQSYVTQRYGGFCPAWTYWQINRWY